MGKSSKQTTKSGPPKWAKPIIQGAAGQISGVVSGNQGNLDAQAGQIRGFLPGLGEKAFGDNPALGAATGYATDVLGGKYLNSNPYLDGMISQTANDVSDRVNSLFAKSGGSLGTQHAGILTRELANAENQLRFGNYSQERQNQQGAAGLMPRLNASQYAGVMPYLAAQQTAGQLPYAGIGNLGAIGGLLGGYGTQTQSGGGGGVGGQIAGGIAAALPFILGASERRVKTKIEAIGTWDDNPDKLTRYRFAYKWSPNDMLEGVMADEVADKRPHALGPIINGIQTVNYSKLAEAA